MFQIAVEARSQTRQHQIEIEPLRSAIADLRTIAIGGRMSVQLAYHRAPYPISPSELETAQSAIAGKLRGEPHGIAHSLSHPALFSQIRRLQAIK